MITYVSNAFCITYFVFNPCYLCNHRLFLVIYMSWANNDAWKLLQTILQKPFKILFGLNEIPFFDKNKIVGIKINLELYVQFIYRTNRPFFFFY